ncbi:MAG: hypothetical protein ACFCUG_06010 [Thiotrichales bacterium]
MNNLAATQKRRVTLAVASAMLTSSIVLMTGCGSEGTFTSPAVTAPETVADQALFAYYLDESDVRRVAKIDPTTFEVLETKENPINAPGGKQKSYFYEGGYVWGIASSSVYALNPETLEPVPGMTGPYIQGSRSGVVGQGQVNKVGAAAPLSAQNVVYDADRTRLLQKSFYTEKELQEIDLCALRSEATQATQTLVAFTKNARSGLTENDVRIHNIGYGNVGNESSPDGKLLMSAVRQGDHILFVDTDPNSPTFGKPARLVYPRYGTVKDASNAVVASFNSTYTAAGGTAPGNNRWVRGTDAASAAAIETDRETYVEPCDSTMLRNHQGQVWSWTVDVDGDTITGVNVDKINTAAPEVYNVPVPVVRQRNFQANIATAGPWMASLSNRNVGAHEFLLFIEYEGENAEGVWNLSDAAKPVELQRMYTTLVDIVDEAPVSFVNGSLYPVSVKFASTGGTNTVVQYRYVALAGDNGTGASPPGAGTTAYLQKVSATDPGPLYLLNGLSGRALTSSPAMSRIVGSGANTTVYSDEVWLDANAANLGWDIVDLRTSLPWRISETIALSSTAGHWFKDRLFQVIGGKIQVIDRASRSLVKEIEIGKGVNNIAFGTYQRAQTAAVTGGSGTTGGAGGTGSGAGGSNPVLPPNPCGG